MAGQKAARSTDALVVSMRELSRKTGGIVKQIKREKRPAVVMNRGSYAAIIQPLDADRIRQLVMESASDLVATRTGSERALAAGKTMTASELAEELGIEPVERKKAKRASPAKPAPETRGGSKDEAAATRTGRRKTTAAIRASRKKKTTKRTAR